MPGRASALAHWFLINFESRPKRLQEQTSGGQNCRALFAYPVGCIISFQLHFRFELIKKCNFRLVVFSIECCPSRGTVAQSPSRAAVRASQVESGRGQSRVESSLSSKLAWLFASSCPQWPMPDARAYIWCIYTIYSWVASSGIVINRHIDPCSKLRPVEQQQELERQRKLAWEGGWGGTMNCELATGSGADPFML